MRFYEDMGLLQPERSGPGGRNRVYSARDRTRLKLTLRATRLGLSLTEAREMIDMYDSPRDAVPQLRKFLTVLAHHREQLEEQLAELQANLDEVRTHEKEARSLLARPDKDNVRAYLTFTSTSTGRPWTQRASNRRTPASPSVSAPASPSRVRYTR